MGFAPDVPSPAMLYIERRIKFWGVAKSDRIIRGSSFRNSPPTTTTNMQTTMTQWIAMAVGNCFLRFRRDAAVHPKKMDWTGPSSEDPIPAMPESLLPVPQGQTDPAPVVHTPVAELRIRIPRFTSCAGCANFRILYANEPGSVCWNCENCTGEGEVRPLYRVYPRLRKA